MAFYDDPDDLLLPLTPHRELTDEEREQAVKVAASMTARYVAALRDSLAEYSIVLGGDGLAKIVNSIFSAELVNAIRKIYQAN